MRGLWGSVVLLGLVWCGDGGRDGVRDAGTAADAGNGVDAALEECSPLFEPWGRVFVDTPNLERVDEIYEMTVTSVGADEFHLYAPPLERDDLLVDVSFPTPEGPALQLMEQGQNVLVQGGTCDSGTNSGYVRVTEPSGEIIWEGGSPYCDVPSRHFVLEPITDATACRWDERPPPPECCCQMRMDWQVLFVVDDPPLPMAPGENTTASIDGHRYYVASQGGYHTLDGPCTSDFTAWFGSAYLSRLAE